MSSVLSKYSVLLSLCLIISCNFFRWGCWWNSKHVTCIDTAFKREFGKCTNCAHHLYTRMLMCIWQMHYEMHRNSVRYTRTICLPDSIYVALVLVAVIPTIFYTFSRSDSLPMISSLHFLFPSQYLYFFFLPYNFPSCLFLPGWIWRLSYLHIFMIFLLVFLNVSLYIPFSLSISLIYYAFFSPVFIRDILSLMTLSFYTVFIP